MTAPVPRTRTQAGQATPLVLAVIFVLVVIMAALVGLGAEAVQRGRLQAAADLTALAAAHTDADGHRVADGNGVALVEVERDEGGAVTVMVSRNGRTAIASATT